MCTSVSPWSFISGMQMPWAQTLCDLSTYLSLHISACALVSACCSFLPSFCQRVSYGTSDSSTCTSLPLRRMAVCMHIYQAHTFADGGLTITVLYANLSLLLSAFGTSNPVCSQSCTEVSALRASTAFSAAFRTLWWCDTGSRRKWPDIHTCFLSTKITLRRAQWEFWANQPAALCLQRTNTVCAGPVGALFFLSGAGMNNSRACHNTPEWSFISSQHCHKVNNSGAIALCFLTCLAAHSVLPCPLVLCPTPFS